MTNIDGGWRLWETELKAVEWAEAHIKGQYSIYPIGEGGEDNESSDEIQSRGSQHNG